MSKKRLRKPASATSSYVAHPFGVTCLECGFLALGDREVSTADRMMLCARGVVLPPLDELHCSRSLWVFYDLNYVKLDVGGIFDELGKQCRRCKGFFRYRPGWSPVGHQDLLLRSQDTKKTILIIALTSVFAFIAGWLAHYFGITLP